MVLKFFLLKTAISISEDWVSKKHTKHKSFVFFFESRNNNCALIAPYWPKKLFTNSVLTIKEKNMENQINWIYWTIALPVVST